MPRKKIILFIVEGISDQTCLSLALSRLLSSNRVQFKITNGDITTEENASPANISKALGSVVKSFLSGVFKPSDIQEVVHLIDTDGAFVPDSAVQPHPPTSGPNTHSATNCTYTTNCIYTDKVQLIRDRNAKKKQILNKLSSTTQVLKNIPYSAYFFSCNLDHALHNCNNLSAADKMKKAEEFENQYAKDLTGFVSFIKDPVFAVSGNYIESWAFIKLDTNSLKRYSNFHLYPPLSTSPTANVP
ncbi:MAG: hypothetical protein PHV76_03810 [Bacteroidales bacterium]|nr:hypothetical protein [Bacteroidales bacterium]